MFDVRDREEFFTSSERSYLVHDILSSPHRRRGKTLCYDDCVQRQRKQQSVDEDPQDISDPLHRLMRRGVYCEAYPLHDGSLRGRPIKICFLDSGLDR